MYTHSCPRLVPKMSLFRTSIQPYHDRWLTKCIECKLRIYWYTIYPDVADEKLEIIYAFSLGLEVPAVCINQSTCYAGLWRGRSNLPQVQIRSLELMK